MRTASGFRRPTSAVSRGTLTSLLEVTPAVRSGTRWPTRRALRALAAPLLLLVFTSCDNGEDEEPPPPTEADILLAVATAAAVPANSFMRNLASACGAAFAGTLMQAPPGDDMLTGTEQLVVHFRECNADTVRIPFHIEVESTGEWDRSRTWVVTRAGDGRLELRHDHRNPDGTPAERTMYGGLTADDGFPRRQDFVSVERTAESGYPRGWRIEIVPGQRYSYGTIREGEWSWRVDFDLTRPIDAPPPPWGFEDGR